MPEPFFAHLGQRAAQLGTAITFQRSQDITGETGRMQASQNRLRRAIGPADFDGHNALPRRLRGGKCADGPRSDATIGRRAAAMGCWGELSFINGSAASKDSKVRL